MYVFTMIPKDHHASYYYRCFVPIDTMENMGLGVLGIVDDCDPEVPMEHRIKAFTHSDINLIYQPTSKNFLHNMEVVNAWRPVHDEDGNWKWPPSTIIDTDDNVYDVHPLNPAYRGIGIRSADGKPLNDGDSVGIEDDQGERKIIFQDGLNGFDIAHNRATLERYREICNKAGAVTCSTPRVQEYVKRESPTAKTYVFPNSVRFDHYPRFNGLSLVKDDPTEIRILWQGSPTHYEDIFALRHALANVFRKYPNVKMVVWGAMYRWMVELLPFHRVEHIRWLPYSQYKHRLCTIGHDINLAPLRGTRFNLCRSAIKFYESSAIPQPAATLAQRTGAYADEIIEGETGLLYDTPDQFAEQLGRLIENETERKTIAANAKDWVNDNRDAFKTVPKLFDFYCQLREEKQETSPVPTEAELKQMRQEWEDWRENEAKRAKIEQEAVDRALKQVNEDREVLADGAVPG